MKLVDANVLIYAVNDSGNDERYRDSRAWLEQSLVGIEAVGFSWIVVLAFMRLTTKIGLFPHPLTVAQANECVRSWLAQPAAVIVEPTARHFDVLAGLLAQVGTGGNLVSDAHLAALASEHDATIITYDTDFARFAGVASAHP